jgi:hypothetical protein
MKTPTKLLPILGVSLPALAISALGLSHPRNLTPSAADWWVNIHLILLPLFPLLGITLWILVRGERGILPWLARIGGFLFIPFYTALDAIDGIAAGTLKVNDAATHAAQGNTNLFAIGNALGAIGGWALLAGAVFALATLASRTQRWALFLPGVALILGGAYFFKSAHIYWPIGGVALLAFGIGAALVELARVPRVATVTEATDPRTGEPLSGGSAAGE